MLYKRPRQYSFSDFMCKTNIPAPSFFMQQVYILFKKENKNFNNVKDLMKNAVFRIPLRKKKRKKEIDSECQFALSDVLATRNLITI